MAKLPRLECVSPVELRVFCKCGMMHSVRMQETGKPVMDSFLGTESEADEPPVVKNTKKKVPGVGCFYIEEE